MSTAYTLIPPSEVGNSTNEPLLVPLEPPLPSAVRLPSRLPPLEVATGRPLHLHLYSSRTMLEVCDTRTGPAAGTSMIYH